LEKSLLFTAHGIFSYNSCHGRQDTCSAQFLGDHKAFKKPYDLPVDSSAEGYFLILVLDENQTNSSINPVTQLSLERNLFLKWISSIFCTGN
jgi:hypothetical protein